MEKYKNEASELLRKLVSIPSHSGEEDKRATFIEGFLSERGLRPQRTGNNILVSLQPLPEDSPVLMLNSHIDTVKPCQGYTNNPYNPGTDPDTIFGLGSNDAGGAMVSMIATLLYFNDNSGELAFNLKLLLSAEEETSGPLGISYAVKSAGNISCAIVGEPTQMRCAVAERGLLVLDCVAVGKSGHAAREEGDNAIYIAIRDIAKMRSHKFSKVSPLMGNVKLTVTQIESGTQHNVVPERCNFVVDIRPTDQYNNMEILRELQSITKSNLTPRNLYNRSSSTPQGHPLFICAKETGVETFISPTTSDWMRLDVPAVKMGPGDSARSHRADEFITKREIELGVEGYITFIKNLKL